MQNTAQESPQNLVVKISTAGVKLAKKPGRQERLAERRRIEVERRLRRREKKQRKLEALR